MPSIRKKLAGKKTKLARPRENLQDHPAAINNYVDGSFYKIDIELITPDPNQPRQFFNPDALSELSESIKQKGVLQPVIIRKDEENKIWLVAGERRFRAAKMAGLEKIPAILTTGNPSEISLIENIQREDLNPIEEAEAMARMIKEYSYTQEKLALVLGKARTTITQTLSLNKLPADIKKECPRGDIPKRVLIEIARKETLEEMRDLYKKYKAGLLKSDEIQKVVRKREKKPGRTPAAIALNRAIALSAYLERLDFDVAEEDEKLQLTAELQTLKKLIGDFLN